LIGLLISLNFGLIGIPFYVLILDWEPPTVALIFWMFCAGLYLLFFYSVVTGVMDEKRKQERRREEVIKQVREMVKTVYLTVQDERTKQEHCPGLPYPGER